MVQWPRRLQDQINKVTQPFVASPNSLLSLFVFLIFKLKLINNFYLIKFSMDCSFTFMSARQNWTSITDKCTKTEQLEIWTCKSRGSEFKSHHDL